MVRLSEKRLRKNIFLKISDQLIDSLVDVNSRSSSKRFLKDILGDKERIMLAKRLAIIFMLERGYSFEAISKSVKVSLTTISKIWRKIKTKEIEFIPDKIRRERKKEKFWSSLEESLRFGLPPMGRGRWRWFLNPEHRRGKRAGEKK